jgi:hypothetical protein
MTKPDLDKDVFIVCSCEKECRKDGHPLLASLYKEGARCSVWVSEQHVAVIAAGIIRRRKRDGTPRRKEARR